MCNTEQLQPNRQVVSERAVFWVVWACLLMAHFYLCHPLMVARTRPPAGEMVSLFVIPLFVWLPSLVGDARMRRRGVLLGGAAVAMSYSIVIINLSSARPHIGHTHGVIGVVYREWASLILYTLGVYLPFVVVLNLYEQVWEGFLKQLCKTCWRVAMKRCETKEPIPQEGSFAETPYPIRLSPGEAGPTWTIDFPVSAL